MKKKKITRKRSNKLGIQDGPCAILYVAAKHMLKYSGHIKLVLEWWIYVWYNCFSWCDKWKELITKCQTVINKLDLKSNEFAMGKATYKDMLCKESSDRT